MRWRNLKQFTKKLNVFKRSWWLEATNNLLNVISYFMLFTNIILYLFLSSLLVSFVLFMKFHTHTRTYMYTLNNSHNVHVTFIENLHKMHLLKPTVGWSVRFKRSLQSCAWWLKKSFSKMLAWFYANNVAIMKFF